MGICAYAKGLTDETGFDCGYLTYGHFMMQLAETAYGKEMGELYKKLQYGCDREQGYNYRATQEDCDFWNARCNDDLDLLLFHSDCDGKFTPQECRRIYKALKPLQMDMIGHNYGVMKPYNMLEHWKEIFKHCADRRVNLYYS